ncbi:aromatic acid exporter family protein [Algimonas porphyrae]|uniref:Integral membrane bound transporter domain-containing protein n=1 Tax=Algimonas porphyrae TaxID=1128113 RepID=A0ABQ5V665_9PROT|nr:FUSC family protein [Algimonas porphyrae]GLQ21757.1 hypothetical protein GCM10007854_27120 [Algimonas porphyrae]
MMPNFDFDRQKTRDAFRLGLQSAFAAVICFLALEVIGSDEKFLGVLSAVLIVQPSVGKTVTAGWERFLSTLLGSAIGLLCLFLLPNAYSVIIALAVVMFVMNVIAGFRPDWRYGVVAAVALALADTSGDFEVAQTRAIAIGVGIVIGILVSLIVWPESAAKRAKRYRRQALNAAADRYKWALQDERDDDEADDARQRFHTALTAGRDVANAAKGREQDILKDTFESVDELYHSIVLIHRVDSPLSRFDDSIISRKSLIESGQTAICSLLDAGDDFDTAMTAFKEAIDKVEESLVDRDMSDDGSAGAASVVFALNEMVSSIERAQDIAAEPDDTRLKTPSAVRELMP